MIDDGGRLNNIPLICSQLKQYGFDVSFITGGINAWTKLNKSFIGKVDKIVKLDELGSEHFYFDVVPDDVLFINMGAKKNSLLINNQKNNLFTNYVEIPLKQNSKAFIQKLKNTVTLFPQVTRVFIYDDDGNHYQAIKKQLKAKLKPTVFYLKGGYRAFKQFDSNRLALLQKKRVKPNQFFGCKG